MSLSHTWILCRLTRSARRAAAAVLQGRSAQPGTLPRAARSGARRGFASRVSRPPSGWAARKATSCVQRLRLELPQGGFVTRHGEALPEVEVTWEQWGDAALPASRTIVIFPSFSHPPHVAHHIDDPSPGWWEPMVGPGKYIDTNKWRVICPAILGSAWGATCPLSVNPNTGTPYRASFPQITPADQAACHAAVLRQLGLERVHAVVGVSLGGMQVLQFASLFPDMAERIVAISCTAKTTPATVAVRHVQRQAILADPDYCDGNYELPRRPTDGMRVARELGLIYYRSREEFDARFDWKPNRCISCLPLQAGQANLTLSLLAALPISLGRVFKWRIGSDITASRPRLRLTQSACLQAFLCSVACCSQFAMDSCYLLLSMCCDLMDIGNDTSTYKDGVLSIAADALLVAVDTDYLTPPEELRAVADLLRANDRPVRYELLSSPFGHDSFLKEFDLIGRPMQEHLEKGLREELEAEAWHTTGSAGP